MRSTTFTTAALLSALSLVQAQTFTDCDPTKKTCPADPAIGGTLETDFTKGASGDWSLAQGTVMSYGSDGAYFDITIKHEAPTIETNKYIFFGKVSANIKSSPGTGIVSSFILESDDLDEIDWEWLGSDNGNVQTNFFGKGDTTTYDRGGTSAVSTPIDSWHNYEIDWNADRIVWSIDGTAVRTLLATDPTAHGGTRYPQTPMKIKMGNWIGCLDASDPKTTGTCEWAGGQAVFDASTKYRMTVKDVKIEDAGCGDEYVYGDMSGTWQSIKTNGDCDGKPNTSAAPSSTATSAKPSSSGSSKASSSTTTKGGVFVESSTTTSSVSESTSASQTTLSTAKASITDAGAATETTPTTTGSPAATATGAASKTKYGKLDVAVMVLGLGLGYLVM